VLVCHAIQRSKREKNATRCFPFVGESFMIMYVFLCSVTAVPGYRCLGNGRHMFLLVVVRGRVYLYDLRYTNILSQS
jgi:hypothetical protein